MTYIYKNKKTGKYFNENTFFSSDDLQYQDVDRYKKEDVDIEDAEIFIEKNDEWIKQISIIFNIKYVAISYTQECRKLKLLQLNENILGL